MLNQSDLTVSDNAIRQARACGFWENTEARVRGIAAQSAPTTHPSGNVAYGPFILLLRGTQVVSFTMLGPQTIDERPVSACKICRGMMTITIATPIEGREGLAQRPCPRAFDNTQPICDTIKRRTK